MQRLVKIILGFSCLLGVKLREAAKIRPVQGSNN